MIDKSFGINQSDSSRASAADSKDSALAHKLLSESLPEQLAYNSARHRFHAAPAHHESYHQIDQHHLPTPIPYPKPEAVASPAPPPSIGPFRLLPNAYGYSQASNQYWQQVFFEKRQHRFEPTFPPVYSGMDTPLDYPAPKTDLPPNSVKGSGSISSLENFITASKDLNRIVTHDKSRPDFQYLNLSEPEYKKRYAAETVHLGKELGIDKAHMAKLVKNVYAFEGGGWGSYDTLSGMPQEILNDNQSEARLKFHPASDALGYNQILSMETVNDIILHSKISERLNELAVEQPERADVLHAKAQLVDELRDVLTHKSTPFNQPPNKQLAFYASSYETQQAAQSLLLDGDVGPVIQGQEVYYLLKYFDDNKIGDSLNAKFNLEISHAAEYDKLDPDKKMAAAEELVHLIKPSPLTAADPDSLKEFNSSVESIRLKLLALGNPASAEFFAPDKTLERSQLSSSESHIMNMNVMTMRRYGGENGPLSKEARALLDKLTADYFGGYSVEQLQAAAIELANLAGVGAAQGMLKPNYGDLPTSNFFNKDGYESNPVTSRRSVDELLLQIYRVMYGLHDDPSLRGMKQFDDAFNSLTDESAQKN
jgi:hypothetical protein